MTGTTRNEPIEEEYCGRKSRSGCVWVWSAHGCRFATPLPRPLPRTDFFVAGGGLSSSSSALPRAPLPFAGSRPRAPSFSTGFQSLNLRLHALLPISWYSSRVTTDWGNSGRAAKATAERYASRIGLRDGCELPNAELRRSMDRVDIRDLLVRRIHGNFTINGRKRPQLRHAVTMRVRVWSAKNRSTHGRRVDGLMWQLSPSTPLTVYCGNPAWRCSPQSTRCLPKTCLADPPAGALCSPPPLRSALLGRDLERSNHRERGFRRGNSDGSDICRCRSDGRVSLGP